MPEKAPVINPKPTVARAVWIVFIVVTPLLGPRAAAALSNIVPETKNAAPRRSTNPRVETMSNQTLIIIHEFFTVP